MSFTVRRTITVVLLFLASYSALAKEVAPTILQDPVFGLRYSVEKVRFEPLPADVKSKCLELESERWAKRLWIFAHTTDGEVDYFVVGGYAINRTPSRDFPNKYEIDTVGAIFQLGKATCKLIGPPREEFQIRPPDDIALPILNRLASDLAKRFSRAFGGAIALHSEFVRQHKSPGDVSTELQSAFAKNECDEGPTK